MNIREALIAMGYRECKPGKWLKPVGYQCFSFYEDSKEWVNWFRAKTGELMPWDSHHLSDDESKFGSYTEQLKYRECFSRTDLYLKSNFELQAIDL